MQDRLLNAYLAGTVDEAIYKAKSNDLKSQAADVDESLAIVGNASGIVKLLEAVGCTCCDAMHMHMQTIIINDAWN